MSEAARAYERMDFEAAAEALTKAKRNTEDCLQPNQQSIEFSRTGDERFIFSVELVRIPLILLAQYVVIIIINR